MTTSYPTCIATETHVSAADLAWGFELRGQNQPKLGGATD
jgi:hypothetical protein